MQQRLNETLKSSFASSEKVLRIKVRENEAEEKNMVNGNTDIK
jgi:hypothetical protein